MKSAKCLLLPRTWAIYLLENLKNILVLELLEAESVRRDMEVRKDILYVKGP
jgi:hypothetical protein